MFVVKNDCYTALKLLKSKHETQHTFLPLGPVISDAAEFAASTFARPLLSLNSFNSLRLSARPVPSYPLTVELIKVNLSPISALTVGSGIAAASSMATNSAEVNLSGSFGLTIA